jgi:hypothetical protein
LGYGEPKKLKEAEGLAAEAGKMLWTMAEKL